MSGHEKDWLIVDRGGEGVVDIDVPDDYFGHVTVAMSVDPERARRIAACVNAAHGISTDALETVGRDLFDGDTSKILEQRDRLLDVLKEVVRISDRKHDAWDAAHALIDEIEGDGVRFGL